MTLRLLVLLYAAMLLTASTVHAQPPVEIPRGLGYGIAWQQGAEYAAEARRVLGDDVPWTNWVYDHMDDPMYVPKAFSMRQQYARRYIDAANAGPARLWLVGNEPETPHTWIDPVEAATMASLFAEETDVPFACCGIILLSDPATEWGHGWSWGAWMDAYLAAGGPVPDVWSVHIYDAFVFNWHERLDVFRAWASERGITRPVIVAETGFPFGQPSYNALLVEAIGDALDSDPDLLAVYWYSVHDYHGIWHDTDLLDPNGALTPVGEAFLRVRSGVRPQTEWRLWLPGVGR